MPRSKIPKPGSTNREEIYTYICKQLVKEKHIRSEGLQSEFFRFQYNNSNAFALSLSDIRVHEFKMGSLFGEYLDEGPSREFTQEMQLVLTYALYGLQTNALGLKETVEQEGVFDGLHVDLLKLITMHGLFAHVGRLDICEWLEPFLLNSLEQEKPREGLEELDQAFCYFFTDLLKIKKSGQWSSEADYEWLDKFADLIALADSPDAFAEMLPHYCDERFANALDWPSCKAKKRDTEQFSVFQYVLWTALVPYELYSLKYVYESLTGKTLSFDVDHPLLARNRDFLPDSFEPVEDDFIRSIDKKMIELAGDGWRFFDESGKPIKEAPLFRGK